MDGHTLFCDSLSFLPTLALPRRSSSLLLFIRIMLFVGSTEEGECLLVSVMTR